MLLLLTNILSIFLQVVSVGTAIGQYNLYHTIRTVNRNDRNCLYYYLFDNLIYHREDSLYIRHTETYHTTHQIVPFCRWDEEKLSIKILWRNSNSIDFDQLLEQNMSSNELYLWSAPIDFIENYAPKKKNIKGEQQQPLMYHNCTLPRFGTYSEYSFYRDDQVGS